jgi:histidinol-phosphate aminotransferase
MDFSSQGQISTKPKSLYVYICEILYYRRLEVEKISNRDFSPPFLDSKYLSEVNRSMRDVVREGVRNLVPYPPGKPIEELERELGIKDSIKLASNENPLGPSPKAIKAIQEKIPALHRYPDGSAYYLRTKLSDTFGVPFDRIIIGNGSNELIELLIRTFMSEGDAAVQVFPTFLMYEKIVTGAGGRMISVPLNRWKAEPERIEQAVTRDVKFVFLNNPNNPTGTALTREEISYLLSRIPEDVVVVLDEAYIEFVTDPSVADGTALMDLHPMLCVLRTFSKLYGLAGLRIGYGFGAPGLIDFMHRVRQPFNANALAQAAALAALDDEEFRQRTLAVVGEGLAFLYESLDRLGLEYVPTQANFFLIRVPGGGKRLYELMLKEGVIIRAMDSYGLKDYIRISVGTAPENRRFIQTLKRLL